MLAPPTPPPAGEAPASEPFPLADARAVVLQGLLVLGGLAAFLFLLLEYGAALNPLVVAATGLILLWPLRKHAAVRALLLAGGFVLSMWLLRTLGGVLVPFVIVFILAYLLNPAVTAAKRRWKVPRWVSSLVLTLVVVGLLVLFVLLLVPTLVRQLQTLATNLVALATVLPQWVAEAKILNDLDAAGLVDREQLMEQLGTFLPGQINAVVGQVPEAAAAVTRSVGTLIGLLTTVALVPILLFYVLKDYPAIRLAIVRLFPRYRGNRRYLSHTSGVVGNYLRGQITISLIAAVIVSVALLVFGVPFALLIGLMAGLLNMIPNLGAIMTYVIGGLLMLAFGTTADLIVTIAVLVGQSFLEQSVLTPSIMSQQVGLHPVLIIFSLFVFSALLGFLGLLIAVPATALIVGLYRAYRDQLALNIEGQRAVVVPETA
ncbi:MAG: AI-2E family transporter [Rubricoccaceae bacterium]|nr:AI-2E family transporter [Rubricoccaceae bacterium]